MVNGQCRRTDEIRESKPPTHLRAPVGNPLVIRASFVIGHSRFLLHFSPATKRSNWASSMRQSAPNTEVKSAIRCAAV